MLPNILVVPVQHIMSEETKKQHAIWSLPFLARPRFLLSKDSKN